MVEHYLDTVGVTGSIPVSRTNPSASRTYEPGLGTPVSPPMNAEQLAKSLAARFLENGNYEALGTPLGREGRIQELQELQNR